jgi:broad specificity phosphatase PhoE
VSAPASRPGSPSDLRIVLARHGRPDLPGDARQPIRGHEIGRWYRRYDESGIMAAVEPPAALREAARAAGCVVASDTRRAIESAGRLIAADAVRVEAGLREVGFPESLDSTLRLSPNLWVLIARASQMLDRDDAEGGRAAVRARAARAADTLARLAQDHRQVVAIGHGWFNRFVARELRRRGWRGPRFVPSGYWSSVVYARAPGGAAPTWRSQG